MTTGPGRKDINGSALVMRLVIVASSSCIGSVYVGQMREFNTNEGDHQEKHTIIRKSVLIGCRNVIGCTRAIVIAKVDDPRDPVTGGRQQ